MANDSFHLTAERRSGDHSSTDITGSQSAAIGFIKVDNSGNNEKKQKKILKTLTWCLTLIPDTLTHLLLVSPSAAPLRWTFEHHSKQTITIIPKQKPTNPVKKYIRNIKDLFYCLSLQTTQIYTSAFATQQLC